MERRRGHVDLSKRLVAGRAGMEAARANDAEFRFQQRRRVDGAEHPGGARKPAEFQRYYGGRGGVGARRRAGRGAAPGDATPPAAPTPCAEADLNGHHIKVFPAVQFTNIAGERAGELHAAAAGRFDHSNPTGGGELRDATMNGMQQPDNGMRVTLAKITDDQGGEIRSYNSGTSTTCGRRRRLLFHIPLHVAGHRRRYQHHRHHRDAQEPVLRVHGQAGKSGNRATLKHPAHDNKNHPPGRRVLQSPGISGGGRQDRPDGKSGENSF